MPLFSHAESLKDKKYEDFLAAITQMGKDQGDAFPDASRQINADRSDENMNEIRRFASFASCNYETYYCL